MSAFEPYVPEDFEPFWQRTVDEARAVPLDYRRTTGNAFDLPGFTVELINFRGMGGRLLKGWIAYPDGERDLPGFLWIPPYGRESLLPNEYGTREGFVSMSFNFFGHDAFHQEAYIKDRGYFAEGAESPETWVFRRMFQDASIAMRVLQAQPEVDGMRLASMGMSQGAGMSIWLGARCPIVKAVCADMPFLGAMQETLNRPVHRYPLKELTDFAPDDTVARQQVLHTVGYFDTLNMATGCRVPTQVSLGLKDPAARPPNVRAVYNALPGDKALIEYEWGHDWHLDMVENNRNWLLRRL
jgi:cephalosporin-C deacetylase